LLLCGARRLFPSTLLLLLAAVKGNSGDPLGRYLEKREALIAKEDSNMIGGGILLTPLEHRADVILRNAKASMLLEIPSLPAIHFFDARNAIERSRLFGLLRRMPKGAALHVHSDSMGDLAWLVSNATYDSNLHLCGDIGDTETAPSFRYFTPGGTPPKGTPPCLAGWRPVSALRDAARNVSAFDRSIWSELSLEVDRRPAYGTISDVWAKFGRCLGVASGLIFYDPMHTRYLQHALSGFAADGISHVELRQVFQGSIGTTYTLNQTGLPFAHLVAKVARIAKEVGVCVKIIVCVLRHSPIEIISEGMAVTRGLMALYPDTVVGFDLVGQEDPGYPLSKFLPSLLEAKLPYYFHAGETDMVGGSADMNLYDAVGLNATRIGHGYGLGRHRVLRELVSTREIALEVCPLSNQVLLLVADLRNHPLVQFVAEGLPVTVNPDDAALWGAEGVSYDWFQFFLASGNRTGIATLKQLAINSIQYSSQSTIAKQAAIEAWTREWTSYVAWLAA